jgi:hypothetical protein
MPDGAASLLDFILIARASAPAAKTQAGGFKRRCG